MKNFYHCLAAAAVMCLYSFSAAAGTPLGLPPVPIPADNPQTPEKIALGDKLFHDKRFSSTGEVNCATCHAREKVFTDLLPVSEGINKLKGTRSAPTVVNAAYLQTQFWDGREPTLEAQSAQPFVNPIEMGLPNHDPILKIVRTDAEYADLFKKAFGKTGDQITMDEVKKAIGAFERTIISGDSPFDRYQYGGDAKAISPAAKRGLALFRGQARCVSCHVIEETQALFTNNRFHNIGLGFAKIAGSEEAVVKAHMEARSKGATVGDEVLTKEKTSELGRLVVSGALQDMGGFKTPTLRNIAKTAPYGHDGSLAKLEDVVTFYNNGGRVKDTDPFSPYLDGGIRPLKLSKEQEADLVEFLKTLTSPEYEKF